MHACCHVAMHVAEECTKFELDRLPKCKVLNKLLCLTYVRFVPMRYRLSVWSGKGGELRCTCTYMYVRSIVFIVCVLYLSGWPGQLIYRSAKIFMGIDNTYVQRCLLFGQYANTSWQGMKSSWDRDNFFPFPSLPSLSTWIGPRASNIQCRITIHRRKRSAT